MAKFFHYFLIYIVGVSLIVGCSPSSNGSIQNGTQSSKAQKSKQLSKAELQKLEWDITQNADFTVYNGTEWFLLWADLEMSVKTTNGTLAHRRFRLYPKKSSSEEQAIIRPYTSSFVEDSDLKSWFIGKSKIEKMEFVEAAGYKE